MFVGLAEAAEIMAESKNKISVYRGRNKFPKPIQELASGPIWIRDQIVHFKACKETNLTIYYNDGNQLWKLHFNEPKELFDKTIDEFMQELYESEKATSYTVLHKEQIAHLKEAMKNPNLVRHINQGSVAAHFNYGLISDTEYKDYLDLLKTAPPTLV